MTLGLSSLPVCIKSPHKAETSFPLEWRAHILATSPVPCTVLKWLLSLCGNTCLGMPHFLYSTPAPFPVQSSHHPSIFTYLEQLAMWMAGPRQSRPPQRGRGESQARARQRQEPELSPSKCSHGCHGDHWPKPPSRVTFRTCRYTSVGQRRQREGRYQVPGDTRILMESHSMNWGERSQVGSMRGFSQDTLLCSGSRGSCWSCPQVCCNVAASRPSRSMGPVPPGTPCQTEVLRLKPAGLPASPVSHEHT